jgi:hypothetical protein
MKPVVIVNGKFMRDGVEVNKNEQHETTEIHDYFSIRKIYPHLPNDRFVRLDIHTENKLPDEFYDALTSLLSTYTK